MQHRAKKRFGQNFLVDANIISKILLSINPQPDDHIVEIGPGLGALTKPLLETQQHLHVIELDRDVIPVLNRLPHHERLTIHNIDVLDFDFTRFKQSLSDQAPLRIIGNLPYNISTAVLFHLVNHRDVIKDMHFMLQKEVVERIAAKTGTHDYGRLSVMMQLHFDVSPLFTVPAECFRPAPKVQSAVIRLLPRQHMEINTDERAPFESLVKQAFSQRRKTLKNTLKNLCDSKQIEQAGIDPAKRPQELDVSDYIKLFRQLNSGS